MKVTGYNQNTKMTKINIKIRKNNQLRIKDVIIYCRVSTQKQEMKAQEYSCIHYCGEKGYNIKQVVTETGSAYKDGHTSKLDEILNKKSNIILLVNRIDRFSRNIVICDKNLKIMKNNNIILKSVHDDIDLLTPIGRHTFRNNISQCQLESEIIGERVRNSIKYRIENGLFIGTAKFGYKIENKVKIQDTCEQSIIKFILDNLYKNKSAISFSGDLFKVLKKYNKTVDFYVNVEFNDVYGNINTGDVYITTSIIRDVLNEYELLKRGKEWNNTKVRNLNNSALSDFDNLTI